MYTWGKGRAAGRVGSGQTFSRQSRVGSIQRFAGSGRVQEKWPVDNSGAAIIGHQSVANFLHRIIIYA